MEHLRAELNEMIEAKEMLEDVLVGFAEIVGDMIEAKEFFFRNQTQENYQCWRDREAHVLSVIREVHRANGKQLRGD